MKLRTTSNINDVFRDLDRLEASITDVAMPRALNELQEQAQTAGLREIAKVYDVGPRTMEKYVSVKFATASDLEAIITVKGKGFPLSEMKPRQTKDGVSVSVKGNRFIIRGTFMATTKSGHVGVFARGAYTGKSGRPLRPTGSFGRFTFGRGERVKRANKWGSSELPINALYTWAPPDAFSNAEVTEAMNDRVAEQAGKVLERNIRFASR